MVPRCARCKSAHKDESTFKTLGGVVGVLIGLVGFGGCIALIDEDSSGFLIFGICIALAFGVYYGIKAIGRPPKGIKSQERKSEFPEVKRRVSEGWGIGEKPPGVE